MHIFHQLTSAALLLVLTLWLQCAGVAGLIEWLRRVVARDIYNLGPIRSGALVNQSTVALIVGGSLVGRFLSIILLLNVGICVLLLRQQLRHSGCGDVVLPPQWRLLGPFESITGSSCAGYRSAF